MAKQKREIRVHHVFKDGTVSDTTAGHTVPAEIVERIHQIAEAVERNAKRAAVAGSAQE